MLFVFFFSLFALSSFSTFLVLFSLFSSPFQYSPVFFFSTIYTTHKHTHTSLYCFKSIFVRVNLSRCCCRRSSSSVFCASTTKTLILVFYLLDISLSFCTISMVIEVEVVKSLRGFVQNVGDVFLFFFFFVSPFSLCLFPFFFCPFLSFPF